MAERMTRDVSKGSFWRRYEHESKSFDQSWRKEVARKRDDCFSAGGKLDGQLEKFAGCQVLVGPMVDSYLFQIGSSISAKLSPVEPFDGK